jgi:3-oxoadipate enol-lactonase
LVKATTEVFLANDLDCYAGSCIMLGDADLRGYLEKLSGPAAIIVGEEDNATPVAAAQQLHVAIPNSTLTIIPGARHLTPIESPEEVAIQLVALLGRV